MALLLRYKYYLLMLIAALIYIIVQSRFGHGDFNVCLGAADYLSRGQNPYKVWLVWNNEVTDMYAYGPAFACMLIPFTRLPLPLPFILFFMLQVLLLIRVFILVERMLPIASLTNRQKTWWWLISIACSLRFILHNIEFGQITILILFLSVEGLYQIFYGSKIGGCLLLGLGIHIKLLPLVFIPYLLWRRQFFEALLCLFFAGLFWLTPLLFGNAFFTFGLFLDWCSTINPFGDKIAQHEEYLSYSMQGLQGLLSAYLLNAKNNELGFKINPVVLSQPVFQILLQGSRLLFILFTLYFLKGSFLKPYGKAPRDFWQLSYLFLVIPIIFPQQQKYSLMLMAPFFCYMVWWLITAKSEGNKRWNIAAFCFAVIILLTTFTSDLFVGLKLNYLFQCLRILTIAAIFSVALLAYAKPVEANETS